MWSGGWTIEAAGDATATSVLARYDGGESTVPADGALEGVHGFFGVVAGGYDEIAAAMRTFVIDGLRGGREFPALVSYNTWFVHGSRIDESNVLREVAEAARVGAELFQLDAGWYAGAGTNGAYDFTTGLGSWKVDQERFPRGLRVIGDEARARGLRFGLWVEPERADLATVGHDEGPREEWLATSGGLYRPGHANDEAGYAQVCLAHQDAWNWAFSHLVRLVEQQGVQYFVVDSNDCVNCTREGHGHGASDGPFAHVQALYRLLAALRERFPELLIENCAGGGNRLDLGLARVTDAGWMDDRTNPAVHVRHNLEQLSLILPPSYLFSYVMPSQAEPMVGTTDFSLLTRSRMPGVMGLSYRADELGDAEYALLEREVDVYKRARALSSKAHAIVLTPTVSESARPAWDVVEHVTPGGMSAVIYAFQNDGAATSTCVVPRQLAADGLFELESADVGSLGTFRGSLLMSDGFELKGSPNTAAHVVYIRPRDASTAARPSRAR
jgi:alpha-galactosidase